jgi:hypothetical protein
MAEAFDLADLVHGSRDGVDQVVDGAAAAHHGLADVHQFRRAGAGDVHAEQRVCLNQSHVPSTFADMPRVNMNGPHPLDDVADHDAVSGILAR